MESAFGNPIREPQAEQGAQGISALEHQLQELLDPEAPAETWYDPEEPEEEKALSWEDELLETLCHNPHPEKWSHMGVTSMGRQDESQGGIIAAVLCVPLADQCP